MATSSSISDKYRQLCLIRTNINEHLPNIKLYASKCKHVTDCGACGVMTSYAIAKGLLSNKTVHEPKIVQIDIDRNETINIFSQDCIAEGIAHHFHHESDLTCPIEKTDMLFIDTWHVYAQLKRELERWHKYVGKYIVMHNTTIDEETGESVRVGHDIAELAKKTGFEVAEISKGLWSAIEEFLAAHPEWKLKERLTYNNGLTVLEREP